MHPQFIHYQLPNHALCRIIRPEEVDAVCYIRKSGHYKNCIVFVTGTMTHQFSIEEEDQRSIFAAAENHFDITINPAKLLLAGPECEVLYKKKRPVNFWLTRHHLSSGQDVSIRYGVRQERIDWRTSYQKLREKSGFEQRYNFQQRAFLELERCNILGIEMERLSIFQNHRAPNYPINHYGTELFGDGTPKTYFELKDWLVERGGRLLEANEQERHFRCRFDFQDIVIKLVYPTRSFECYQSTGIKMTVSNRRRYPDLLKLRPYEKGMRMDQFIELPDIGLSPKYREFDMVRLLPQTSSAEFPDRCILWIDRQKQLIGLSDRSFANIIRLEDIEGFFLLNVAPARGPGWSQFGVVHRQYGDVNLFGSAFRKLDYIQPFIEEELQLPFDSRMGGYDT